MPDPDNNKKPAVPRLALLAGLALLAIVLTVNSCSDGGLLSTTPTEEVTTQGS